MKDLHNEEFTFFNRNLVFQLFGLIAYISIITFFSLFNKEIFYGKIFTSH